MPNLPTPEGFATGGIIAATLAAAGWLIRWFSGLATQGEDLAATRVAALTADFEAYRVRTKNELEAVHRELRDLREAQRRCLNDSAIQAAELSAVKAELAALKGL